MTFDYRINSGSDKLVSLGDHSTGADDMAVLMKTPEIDTAVNIGTSAGDHMIQNLVLYHSDWTTNSGLIYKPLPNG